MNPIIVRFGDFVNGKYPEDGHNLYIVWYEKQALYVGVSHSNLWVRWFDRIGAHIYIHGDQWIGNSRIGIVIEKCRPESFDWRIEFRYSKDVEQAEKELIKKLHPLFNVTYSRPLNKQQAQLKQKLEDVICKDRFDDPPENYIKY